jgi:hypothetical protein
MTLLMLKGFGGREKKLNRRREGYAEREKVPFHVSLASKQQAALARH